MERSAGFLSRDKESIVYDSVDAPSNYDSFENVNSNSSMNTLNVMLGSGVNQTISSSSTNQRSRAAPQLLLQASLQWDCLFILFLTQLHKGTHQVRFHLGQELMSYRCHPVRAQSVIAHLFMN